MTLCGILFFFVLRASNCDISKKEQYFKKIESFDGNKNIKGDCSIGYSFKDQK